MAPASPQTPLSAASKSDAETISVRVPGLQRRRPFYGRSRRVILGLLILKQDGKCLYSFDCCTGKLTDIAHKDHDPTNDDPVNLAASCRPCNTRVSNLGRGKSNRAVELGSVSVPEAGEQGEEDALEKNRRTEPAWVDFITTWLENRYPHPVPKEVLTNNSAHDVDISVATVRRHWKKYGCESGPFRIFRPMHSSSLLVELRKKPGALLKDKGVEK